MCDLKFILTISTVLFEFKAIKCSCSDSRDKSDSGSCWYTFWYVWVALGLFITVVITIVVVYYKHKWSRKRRNRVRRIAVVAPQDPPPYTAPSQHPPSYEEALKTSYPVPPGYMGGGNLDGYIQVVPNRIQRHGTDDSSIYSIPPSYDARHHR